MHLHLVYTLIDVQSTREILPNENCCLERELNGRSRRILSYHRPEPAPMCALTERALLRRTGQYHCCVYPAGQLFTHRYANALHLVAPIC